MSFIIAEEGTESAAVSVWVEKHMVFLELPVMNM